MDEAQLQIWPTATLLKELARRNPKQRNAVPTAEEIAADVAVIVDLYQLINSSTSLPVSELIADLLHFVSVKTRGSVTAQETLAEALSYYEADFEFEE